LKKLSAVSPQPSANHQLPTLRCPYRKGEIAESLFCARALRYGLNVSKPLGQNSLYDFMVEIFGVVRRVQVRSTWGRATPNDGYRVRMSHSRHGRHAHYRSGETDFFAIYLALPDLWYIIPAAVGIGRASICLFPQQKHRRSQWERYREAWHLLLPRGVYVGDIQAAADPNAKPFTAEDAEEEICSLCRP
jgi:PD-(D/E)XK endonuclease